MNKSTACSRNNEEYKKLLEGHKKFLENNADDLTYAKYLAKIINTPYKTVLKWCKKGIIPTEWIKILGRKNYIISIDKLPKWLRVKYLRNLYKSYGIQTRDLAVARHQYNRLKMWGTTDLSLTLEELQALQSSRKAKKKAVETELNNKTPYSNIVSYSQEPKVVRNDDFKAPDLFSNDITEAKKGVSVVPIYLEGKENEKYISPEARLKANAKYDLLLHIESYVSNKKGRKDSLIADYLGRYNEGSLHPNIFKLIGLVKSPRTIRRWREALGESNNYELLIDGYQRKAFSHRSLTDDEVTIFKKIWLTPSQYDVQTAYKYTKMALEAQGFVDVSEYHVFKAFADDFKKNRYDAYILAREGEKALDDKVLPYVTKDNDDVEPGELLVTDGHKLDFQVINPKTGKKARAMMLAYFDQKSQGITGFDVMFSENTQCATSALRNSIINLGRYPKGVHQDNGKAFKNKFFTGNKKKKLKKGQDPAIQDFVIRGLYEKKGIKVRFSAAYNAKDKPIERYFRTFTNSFSKMMPTYVGNNIENRPAWEKRNEKFIKNWHNTMFKGYVPTIEEAIDMIQWWINEVYHEQPCPNVEGKTIGEVLESGKGPGVDIEELDELMMLEKGATLDRGYIRFQGDSYKLTTHLGIGHYKKDKVMVRYSYHDRSIIKVYDGKGIFIGDAESSENHKVASNAFLAENMSEKDKRNLEKNANTRKNADKKAKLEVKAIHGLNKRSKTYDNSVNPLVAAKSSIYISDKHFEDETKEEKELQEVCGFTIDHEEPYNLEDFRDVAKQRKSTHAIGGLF